MIFLNTASSAAALVFYLPGVCTSTDTEGKTEKGQGQEYFKIFGKNAIFNEHPVHNRNYKCFISIYGYTVYSIGKMP